MSLICGIYSPQRPDLASAEHLDQILEKTGRPWPHGLSRFVDSAEGIALAYGHNAAFGLQQDLASWYADDEIVAAVDGDLDATLSRAASSDGHPANPAALAASHWRANPGTFPQGLDGVFSLFLWHKSSRTLHLSADNLSRRLLYYHHNPETGLTVFSSEMKTVLGHAAVQRTLNRALLPLQMLAGLMPAPLTLAEGVRKLLAAESLAVTPEGLSSRRFWRPAFEPESTEFQFWVQRLVEELPAATERTLGAAGEVSIHLSGGMDSSLVAASLRDAKARRVLGLTLTYREPNSSADVTWARRIADLCGLEHQTVQVDTELSVTPQIMADLLGQMDEPHSSADRMISEYFLCQRSREEGINSTLTGAAPNPSLRRLRSKIEAEPAFSKLGAEEALSRLLTADGPFTSERLERALALPQESWQWNAQASVNSDLLPREDAIRAITTNSRLSASVSRVTLFSHFTAPLLAVEERTPFLDTRYSQLILSLPPAQAGLRSAETNRAHLKEAHRRLLGINPDDRPKLGFPGPPRPAWLRRLILPSLRPLAEEGILRPEYVDWLARGIDNGRKRAVDEAWQWFIFNFWYQKQIKEDDPLAAAQV